MYTIIVLVSEQTANDLRLTNLSVLDLDSIKKQNYNFSLILLMLLKTNWWFD